MQAVGVNCYLKLYDLHGFSDQEHLAGCLQVHPIVFGWRWQFVYRPCFVHRGIVLSKRRASFQNLTQGTFIPKCHFYIGAGMPIKFPFRPMPSWNQKRNIILIILDMSALTWANVPVALAALTRGIISVGSVCHPHGRDIHWVTGMVKHKDNIH